MAPTFSFEREQYNAFEIIYITSGRGWFRYGTEWIALERGDGLVYNMREPHAYRSDPEDPYEMKYVVFHGSELDRLWHSWFDAPYLLLPGAADDEPYVRTLQSVLDWMSKEGPESEPNISALLYQLLMQLLLRNLLNPSERKETKPAALERGRLYLEERYAESADIHGAAGAAGLSYYHFIRQFRRYYGYAPKEYLTKIRIGHAKHHLLHSDMPIAEVADSAGFGSYNAFLHSFLQNDGCSPTLYSKLWKRTPLE